MNQPEISVVLPCFNELPNLPELRRRLVAVLEATGRSFEILFVDDGSRDGSFEAMAAFAAEDPRLRALRLSRNFGHQMALTAGVDRARGRLVAVMDADLQDPPELLAEMLAKSDAGFEVVYAQRTARKGRAPSRGRRRTSSTASCGAGRTSTSRWTRATSVSSARAPSPPSDPCARGTVSSGG